jgi:hypothetical protein
VTASAVARAPRRIDEDVVRRAGLAGLVRPASEHAVRALSAERALPVLAELRGLLPGGGLRRGATIAVGGVAARGALADSAAARGALVGGARSGGALADSAAARGALVGGAPPGAPLGARSGGALAGDIAASSVVFALLAAASKAGSWCGVVGMPQLSPIAAGEMGVVLDRLAFVPQPGTEWATVVAALIDGFDIVVAAAAGPVAPAVISRLAARARQRGCVFMPCLRWGGADLTVEAVDSAWEGLGAGHGRLRGRVLTLRAYGRGAAAIPREVRLRIGEQIGEQIGEPSQSVSDNVVPLRRLGAA